MSSISHNEEFTNLVPKFFKECLFGKTDIKIDTQILFDPDKMQKLIELVDWKRTINVPVNPNSVANVTTNDIQKIPFTFFEATMFFYEYLSAPPNKGKPTDQHEIQILLRDTKAGRFIASFDLFENLAKKYGFQKPNGDIDVEKLVNDKSLVPNIAALPAGTKKILIENLHEGIGKAIKVRGEQEHQQRVKP